MAWRRARRPWLAGCRAAVGRGGDPASRTLSPVLDRGVLPGHRRWPRKAARQRPLSTAHLATRVAICPPPPHTRHQPLAGPGACHRGRPVFLVLSNSVAPAAVGTRLPTFMLRRLVLRGGRRGQPGELAARLRPHPPPTPHTVPYLAVRGAYSSLDRDVKRRPLQSTAGGHPPPRDPAHGPASAIRRTARSVTFCSPVVVSHGALFRHVGLSPPPAQSLSIKETSSGAAAVWGAVEGER